MTNYWTCEIYWQNSDGDENSSTASFPTNAEAHQYGESRMGTFNRRGRLGVHYETYPYISTVKVACEFCKKLVGETDYTSHILIRHPEEC